MIVSNNGIKIGKNGSIKSTDSTIEGIFECNGVEQSCALYCYFRKIDLDSTIQIDIDITGHPTAVGNGIQQYATGAAILYSSIDGGNQTHQILPTISYLVPNYTTKIVWSPHNPSIIIHSFSMRFGIKEYPSAGKYVHFRLSNLMIGGKKFKFDTFQYP